MKPTLAWPHSHRPPAPSPSGLHAREGGSQSGPEREEEDSNYTIAVVPKDATNPWFVRKPACRSTRHRHERSFRRDRPETDATLPV